MKSILITAVTLFVLSTHMSSPALAKNFHEGENNIQYFIGQWEAIDPDDGSHQIMSITDNGDGKVKLLLFDTFWTLCEGGRGLIQGTGEIEGKRSLKSDDFAITCFNDVTPPEAKSITFILNRDSTLSRPAIGGTVPSIITYHRTSK